MLRRNIPVRALNHVRTIVLQHKPLAGGRVLIPKALLGGLPFAGFYKGWGRFPFLFSNFHLSFFQILRVSGGRVKRRVSRGGLKS
jgi:hypothetical protein